MSETPNTMASEAEPPRLADFPSGGLTPGLFVRLLSHGLRTTFARSRDWEWAALFLVLIGVLVLAIPMGVLLYRVTETLDVPLFRPVLFGLAAVLGLPALAFFSSLLRKRTALVHQGPATELLLTLPLRRRSVVLAVAGLVVLTEPLSLLFLGALVIGFLYPSAHGSLLALGLCAGFICSLAVLTAFHSLLLTLDHVLFKIATATTIRLLFTLGILLQVSLLPALVASALGAESLETQPVLRVLDSMLLFQGPLLYLSMASPAFWLFEGLRQLTTDPAGGLLVLAATAILCLAAAGVLSRAVEWLLENDWASVAPKRYGRPRKTSVHQRPTARGLALLEYAEMRAGNRPWLDISMGLVLTAILVSVRETLGPDPSRWLLFLSWVPVLLAASGPEVITEDRQTFALLATLPCRPSTILAAKARTVGSHALFLMLPGMVVCAALTPGVPLNSLLRSLGWTAALAALCGVAAAGFGGLFGEFEPGRATSSLALGGRLMAALWMGGLLVLPAEDDVPRALWASVFYVFLIVAVWRRAIRRLSALFERSERVPSWDTSALTFFVGMSAILPLGYLLHVLVLRGSPLSLALALSYVTVSVGLGAYAFITSRNTNAPAARFQKAPSLLGSALKGFWTGLGLVGAGVAYLYLGVRWGLLSTGNAEGTGFLLFEAAGDSLGAQLAVWATIALVIPLAEEAFFRGLLHRTLRDALQRPWVARGLSSLAFASLHPLMGAPPVFLVGFATAWLFDAEKRLLPCIVAHSIYNFTLILLATGSGLS